VNVLDFAIASFFVGGLFGIWCERNAARRAELKAPPTDDPWPLDVRCPICRAPAGRFCNVRTAANHSGRYEASPGANAAKREGLT